MRALSNPMTTSPSTTRAGAERTPKRNSSSRASSSIIRSFLTNSTPLPVRYSDSAVQGPQKGCEYTVICRSPISFPLGFFLLVTLVTFLGLRQLPGLLLPCLPQPFLPCASASSEIKGCSSVMNFSIQARLSDEAYGRSTMTPAGRPLPAASTRHAGRCADFPVRGRPAGLPTGKVEKNLSRVAGAGGDIPRVGVGDRGDASRLQNTGGPRLTGLVADRVRRASAEPRPRGPLCTAGGFPVRPPPLSFGGCNSVGSGSSFCSGFRIPLP